MKECERERERERERECERERERVPQVHVVSVGTEGASFNQLTQHATSSTASLPSSLTAWPGGVEDAHHQGGMCLEFPYFQRRDSDRKRSEGRPWKWKEAVMGSV